MFLCLEADGPHHIILGPAKIIYVGAFQDGSVRFKVWIFAD